MHSAGYAQGNSKMLLRKVLVGKPYNMAGQDVRTVTGCGLKPASRRTSATLPAARW